MRPGTLGSLTGNHIKGTPESPLTPSTMRRRNEKMAFAHQEVGPPLTPGLDPEQLPFRAVRNKGWLFKPPRLW